MIHVQFISKITFKLTKTIGIYKEHYVYAVSCYHYSYLTANNLTFINTLNDSNGF